MISNEEFLRVLCQKAPPGGQVWVTSFEKDPSTATGFDWRGHAYDATKPPEWSGKANNYFSICAVKPNAATRADDTFLALLAVVLDDIGTKVPLGAARPEPSWVLETSKGNYQYGYFLRDALSDIRTAKRLIGGLTAKGLTDPGSGTIVRFARLPVGWNSKAEHAKANGGKPWPVRLTNRHPERRYTVQDFADAFGISLVAQRGRPPGDVPSVGPENDPFFALFDRLGLLTGRDSNRGWYGMTCPWEEEHTTPDAGTSCAYKPGGGWRCLHGHCSQRRFSDVLAWLREQHGVDTDALLRDMPNPAGVLARGIDRYVYAKDVEAFVDLHTGRIDSKVSLDDFYFGATGGRRFSQLLLLREDLRRVECTTYRPGDAPLLEEGRRSAVNLWLPSGVRPAETVDKAKLKQWHEHLSWLFPDEVDKRLVLDFLTHLVKQRGRKINWALVLLAREQGTGRDTLVTPIRGILGDRNVAHINGEHLDSQFNDYAIAELVFASELDTSDVSRRQIYKKLKEPIAKPPDRIRVNIKFLPARDMPKVANFLIFTNDPAALAIDDADRRFAVVETQRTRAEVQARATSGAFRALHKRYAEPGWLENFYAALLKRKISPSFDAEGRAPETPAKRRMMRAAEAPEKALLRDWLEALEGPFATDLFEVRHVSADLASKGYGVGTRLLEMYLRDLGAEHLGRVRVGSKDSERANLWAARDVARYASMAQQHPAALVSAYRRRRR